MEVADKGANVAAGVGLATPLIGVLEAVHVLLQACAPPLRTQAVVTLPAWACLLTEVPARLRTAREPQDAHGSR